MQKLLTTKEVAEYFQVSDDTVTRKFIKEGLKHLEIGPKDYRYNIVDIAEFERQKIEETERKKSNQKKIYAKSKVVNLF